MPVSFPDRANFKWKVLFLICACSLILVHGIGDDISRQRRAWNFWSKRLRDAAVVTTFPFVEENSYSPDEKVPSLPFGGSVSSTRSSPERDKTINFGSLGFAGRAEALLDKIVRTDAKQRALRNPASKQAPEPFVYIFLAHDLGASLVQQALELASHHKRYLHIANYTAALVFCERPSGIHVEDVAHREDEILRFASKRHPDSRLPFGVLRDLPCDLESIAWAFEGIKRHYVMLDVSSQDGQGTPLRVGEQFASQRRVTLSNADLKLDVWRVEPGHAIAEQIFDFIKRVFVKEARFTSKAFRNFLALLSSVSASNRQLRLSRPFPNTLNWVTEHQSYKDWRVLGPTAPDILYLSGPSGSGSSVIASHLIAELQVIPDATVISFSFDKQDQRAQPISSIYVSLIRQILFTRPELFQLIFSVAGWVKNEDVFGFEILAALFLTLLKGAYPNPVFCVIHAAEDCKDWRFDDFVTVLRRFRAMPNNQTTFKVVVFDEKPREGLFEEEAAKSRDIDLSDPALYMPDVRLFVESKVDKLAIRHPEWEGYEEHIIEQLCSRDTSFLHASFSARLLETAKIPSTIRGVKTVVDNLPWTLDEMYALTVQRCAADLRTPLTPLLQWVVYAVRPLSLNELAVVPALATSGDPTWDNLKLDVHLRIATDIRPLKGNLVRPSGLQVYPIHSTMEPALSKVWRDQGEDPEVTVFSQCLTYLELALEHLPDVAEANPTSPTNLIPSHKTEERRAFALLGYAATHWPYHYKLVRDRLSDELKKRVLEFISAGSNGSLLYRLHELYAGQQSARFPAFDTPLKIACRFGLVDLLTSLLLGLKSTENFKTALGEALDLAAGYGHADVVDILLKEGASCNNALCLASKNNFFGIVQLLVDKRAGAINRKDDQGRSPFLLAALNGNETIGAYLLEKGAKVGIDDRLPNKSTVVHVAARSGQSKVFKKLGLIDSKFDLGALDQWGNDAFLLAAEGGFDTVVQMLLEQGVATNRQNDRGYTALHRAVVLGHASTCDVLLDAGVDILSASKMGFTPIHLAAREGHLGILEKLIGRLGGNYMSQVVGSEQSTHERVGYGGNEEATTSPTGVVHPPLELAALYGHVNTVQALLKLPLCNSSPTRTAALKLAASQKWDIVVAARPPLELAALHGHVDTVRELLRYSRYRSEPTRATALMLAAAQGWDIVVKELLNSTVTTVVHDEDGNNALHLAVRFQYPHIIPIILSSPGFISVNSAADNAAQWTPLHLAAEVGRLLTIRVLLSHGANPQAVAGDGTTALHIAAASGHVSTTEELMKALDDLDLDDDTHPLYLEDAEKRTPFVRAVENGHKDVAVAILEKLVKPTILPADSKHPRLLSTDVMKLQGQLDALYLAVASKNEALVKFLVASRYWDTNARNADNPNGLHLAASSAFKFSTSMLEILLEAGADRDARYPEVDDENAPRAGDRPLHVAVRDGRHDAIKALLKIDPPNKGADINAVNDQGITPTYLAAYLGRAYELKELLRWNPDLGIKKTDSGWTALHAAYDDASIITLLLDEGADPYALNNDGRPPFFLSADEEDGTEILRVYLDHPNAKVNPNWRMKGGWPVIHTAASGGTVQTLQLLLERGADINAADDTNRITPLHTVLSEGSADAVRFLLGQNGADLAADSVTYGTVLMAAAGRDDHGESVRLILDKGVDVNAASSYNDHFTALQSAAYAGYGEAVRALLEAGADVNLTGGKAFGSPLLAAIMSGSRKRRTGVTKLLLDAGAEANYAGSTNGTALEWALSHGRQGIIELLLEKERKVDVNAFSKSERLGTPLIAAVDAGDVPSIEKLLARGADPNLSRASDTETPAQVAVRRGRLSVLEVLLRHGADLSYQGPLRRRVLSHAIGWKSTDLLDLLWDRPEVDINEQDVELHTPLIIAAREGGISVVEKLIARGANPNAQDRLGQTALIHATYKDFGYIVAVLINEGHADPSIEDRHGRDALYWAARSSGADVFSMVLNSMKGDGLASAYESAVYAAIASNRYELVKQLLQRIQRLTGTDRDGWTALYTAKMYQYEWIDMIEDATPLSAEAMPKLKLPAGWDPHSLLCVSVEGGKTLTVGQSADFSMTLASNSAEFYRAVRGIVRADHAMVPVQDGVYYFEVEFKGVSGAGEIGVGFCEEHAETDAMLGHKEAAWGYHGDDGCIFGVDHRIGSGLPYGPKYSEGDIVGCGVNFDKGTVFYTLNGKVLGRAYTDIKGKLYPAVCMNVRMHGCRISATFWDGDSEGKPFKYTGDFTDPSTFEVSEYALKRALKRSETFGREKRDGIPYRKHSTSDEDFEDSASYSSEGDDSSD